MNFLSKVLTALKEMYEWYKMRNKVLFEDADGWNSGSEHVEGISKYSTIATYLSNGVVIIMATSGGLGGYNFFGTSGASFGVYQAIFAGHFSVNPTTEICTFGNFSTQDHDNSAGHSAYSTLKIVKIVGLEPIKSGGGIRTPKSLALTALQRLVYTPKVGCVAC